MRAFEKRPATLTLILLLAVTMVPLWEHDDFSSTSAAQESANRAQSGGKGMLESLVHALLYVEKVPPRILQDKPHVFDKDEFTEYLRRQEWLLRSHLVLDAALTSADAAKLAVVKAQAQKRDWLMENLQVQADPATGLIRVAVNAGTTMEQVVLVNAVVKRYLRESTEHDARRSRDRLSQLKKLFGDYDSLLREKQKVLRAMSDGLDLNESGKLQFALKRQQALEQELIETQSQARKAKVELELLRTRAKQVQNDAVDLRELQRALDRDPAVLKALGQVAQLETTLTTIRQISAKPDNEPVYKKVLESLEAARRDAASVREGAKEVLVKQVSERRRTEMEAQGAAIEDRLNTFAKLEESLTDAVKQNREVAAKLHRRTMNNFDWLRDEIAMIQKLTDRIGSQMGELEIEIQAPSRLKLIQEAQAGPK